MVRKRIASLSRAAAPRWSTAARAHGCNLKLLRSAREHIEREDTGENEDCRDQQQRDVADYSDRSAHGDYLWLGRFVVVVFLCSGFRGDQRPTGLAAFPRLSGD